MIDAIVFNGAASLDFTEIRLNVVRIPQVIARLKEAQQIWEQIDPSGPNLYQYLVAEEAVFMGNIKLKSLVAAIVQVGLLDRYLKSHSAPRFMLGDRNGDSALQVSVGTKTLKDLIFASKALHTPNKPIQVISLSTPILSGVSLTEYGVYEQTSAGEFKELKLETQSIAQICQALVDDHGVQKFINVGPGQSLFDQHMQNFTLSDVQVLDSIDLDPMLSWFWPNVRKGEDYMQAL